MIAILLKAPYCFDISANKDLEYQSYLASVQMTFLLQPSIVHPGVLHSALTALVAGLIMVGVRTSLHNEDPTKWELLNNGKIGVKFVVLLLILFIGYRNVKKTEVKKSTLYTMISLTTLNILLALFW